MSDATRISSSITKQNGRSNAEAVKSGANTKPANHSSTVQRRSSPLQGSAALANSGESSSEQSGIEAFSNLYSAVETVRDIVGKFKPDTTREKESNTQQQPWNITQKKQKENHTQTSSEQKVVQRVTVQILPSEEEDGVIGDIAIAGRPDSIHKGTMGDHSTAYTAIQMGLETRLKGLDMR